MPAACECVTTAMTAIALTMIPASTACMLQSTLLVFAAIEQRIIFGKGYYRHHFVGICLIIAGVLEVGLIAAKDGSESQTGSVMFGMIAMIVAQIATTAKYMIEESVLLVHDVDDMLMVGLEGMWGLLIYLLALTPMQMLTCGEYYVSDTGTL